MPKKKKDTRIPYSDPTSMLCAELAEAGYSDKCLERETGLKAGTAGGRARKAGISRYEARRGETPAAKIVIQMIKKDMLFQPRQQEMAVKRYDKHHKAILKAEAEKRKANKKTTKKTKKK